ncbi:ABC transporter ATP-binding protein [Streptococcus equi]|uniref:ABC transporter ATP-binding protein n=1 Tax=Streptococcus equi TaxID=1336 RepID=UPI0005BD48F9|nr:dipeptide/oligopeptide/nickel ABC transporter ATP-binding protein [Streptococcus equi]VTP93623.1 ABC transporter ATP-binding protein [Streptococcus equi subsp. zooepidemicus]KIS16833.1 ABC transporter ATP-binding protein [Streptococcus equi subsp. zooepidemicus SzAM35]HEK9995484.1 ABC transporter ATP-binding protein [Streptococcus equi subsp. zooepidemicus]HEL0553025.1 ABC transporter ATP-binding protein [Streptococcus equi subsp. zooepidemicus]HEL0584035.1 ABC transporter ATP-binding prote
MIEFRHVYKSFHQKPVLTDCHFQMEKGESLGIMGESGSGKTTLARLIIGLEQPTAGQVLFHGQPYSVKVCGPRILLVFQDALRSVNPLFTIQEILTEALSKDFALEEVVQILAAVGLDATHLGKKARELSGGQLQRVCIARALLLRPEVIIFDEALSGLDPITQGQLLDLLYELKQAYQLTYIFIAHNANICQAICDRVLLLEQGRLVAVRDKKSQTSCGDIELDN